MTGRICPQKQCITLSSLKTGHRIVMSGASILACASERRLRYCRAEVPPKPKITDRRFHNWKQTLQRTFDSYATSGETVSAPRLAFRGSSPAALFFFWCHGGRLYLWAVVFQTGFPTRLGHSEHSNQSRANKQKTISTQHAHRRSRRLIASQEYKDTARVSKQNRMCVLNVHPAVHR